jgi:xylulokinase
VARQCTIGVDIGTSSSKGVIVDAATGEVLATATSEHTVDRPHTGWVQMDGRIWWDEFVALAHTLHNDLNVQGIDVTLTAVGVSGMGPCVLLTDDNDDPVFPAILYGVDTRTGEQIARMREELGDTAIAAIGGSLLSSQAGGPKVSWIADNEPDAYQRATRLFMPASYLARKLTGAYVLDHQSASQMSPLYEVDNEKWHEPWWGKYAPGILAPTLVWAGDTIGHVTEEAATQAGLPAGLPVIAGTIDAWTEAVSVHAHNNGDLMLMYGTTMFLVATGEKTLRSPSMWTTVGVFPGSRNLAGGLSTSGALTAWVKDLTGSTFPELLAEAELSTVGSNGLLMLPYFAGERTPIQDPDARGVIAGLTLRHTRGDLYRAALEATAFAVRHNIETMVEAGADIRRIVAVGGGTQGDLWLQIISDVTGVTQEVPQTTVGASYGAAFLAAQASADTGAKPDMSLWNPVTKTITPQPENADRYNELYPRYLELYRSTVPIVHALAADQRMEGNPDE